jgi:hypothetical protein
LVGDGQYAESVNLSRMGIGRGGSIGDLVIRGQSLDATIRPLTGQAAFFNSASFSGDLRFEQLTVSGSEAGAGTRGVQLNQFVGDLTAEDLIFEQLSDAAFDLTGVTGDVWIQSNLLDRLGDSNSDAAIRVSQLSGAAVITGNDFLDVRGAALDLANGGNGESTWLIDDNQIYGDVTLFSTTVTGIRASLVGDSRTDLTLHNNAFDGLAGSAIDLQVQDRAELQTRWLTNSATNLQGSAAAQWTLGGSAVGVLLSDSNTWATVYNSGMSLRVEAAARLNATVQYDAFTDIGDGQGAGPEEALTVTTSSDATGRVDLFLFNNSISTVTGSGLRIAVGGASAVRAVITDNFFYETNTKTLGGALVVEHASDVAQATVDLRVERNDSPLRNQSDAYLLRQLGTAVMRLERAGGTATAYIEAQNFGGPVTVIGTVGTIPPGHLDASLPLTLGDTVWWDDGDGEQNLGEQGVGGVVIHLAGTETASGVSVNRLTQSDASGTYMFPGLAAGQYTLILDVPFAVRLATANQGTDDATDSDFDSATNQVFVLLVGPSDIPDVDAGLWRTWQNPRNPLDADDDGAVLPLDVLLLINDINAQQARALPIPPVPPLQPPPYLDVSGDGNIGPQDVLIIINYLNGATAGASGEGEAAVGSSFDEVGIAPDAVRGSFESGVVRRSPAPAPGVTVRSQESGRPAVGGLGEVGRPVPNANASVLDDVDELFTQLGTAGELDTISESP